MVLFWARLVTGVAPAVVVVMMVLVTMRFVSPRRLVVVHRSVQYLLDLQHRTLTLRYNTKHHIHFGLSFFLAAFHCGQQALEFLLTLQQFLPA
jgi:hypothetical protein